MKIIFAGSGEFGLPTLKALVDRRHSIVGVFTQPDRPAGRGKQLTPTPVGQFWPQAIRTADINKETLPEADVMVVIAFGQKIADAVVHHPRLGSVNLHASRLPKYRGAAPINWAIINGDDIAGNSIIRLASKMDAGAVLGMTTLPIGDSETAGELHERLSQDGPALMLSVLDQLEAGRQVETEQDHAAASIAPKLNRDTATIDWSHPAKTVARRINGLSPWPGCRVAIMDGEKELARLTLLRVAPLPEAGTPGMLVNGRIGCSDGSIQLLDVLPEGRRAMPFADFSRGRLLPRSIKVVSIR